MAKEIYGILIYTQPNKYTVTSQHSPYHIAKYVIHIDASSRGISKDEEFLVGTHCGTEEFNSARVEEYSNYRRNIQSFEIILCQNFPGVNLYDKSSHQHYTSLLYKKWFGKHYVHIG